MAQAFESSNDRRGYTISAKFVAGTFSPGNVPYYVMVFFLVVGFAFFYTLVIFQQQNLAENLQRQGGFVPGIRPGRPTQDYIMRVLVRITWAGALFLGVVAIVPFFATRFANAQALDRSAAPASSSWSVWCSTR